MSIRYEINDIDDLDISDDKTELEVLFCSNYQGNQYVDIPIEMIKECLSLTKTPEQTVVAWLHTLDNTDGLDAI